MTGKLATGFLIDPAARAIGPITIDPDMLSELYLVLGCNAVEYVRLDDEHFIYVDEEGLLKEDKSEIKPFFQIKGHYPMAGRGIVFGVHPETGEAISATVRIGDLWGAVTFPDVEYVGTEHESAVRHDPVLGDVASITITPVFKKKGSSFDA